VSKLIAISSAVALLVGAAIGLGACGSGGGGKEGGTLKATYAEPPDYLDPALSYTAEGWTAMADTYIGLLTYAHAEGEAGSKVVPGLAESLPKISDDGKTYTLKLRKGLKYSDGTPVRASDFRYAVERMIKLNSGGTPFFTKIAGAEKFAETKQGGISGIQTNDKTGEIVIELTGPSSTFTFELGLMFSAPVPPDTPAKDQTPNPPPATGPYMITSSDPGRSWSYARNPYWAKANGPAMPDYPDGHVDKADVTVIRNDSTQVNEIEKGSYNWMQNPPPADRYAQLKEKYEGTQLRVEPTISTYYFWMNEERAPFDDLKVRRAVNYAIDSRALERIYAGQLEALHQILPPGMPGHEPFNLYPHNMAKAKKLIAEANPSDRDITVWTDNESPQEEVGAYYQDVLKKLGFNAKLKVLGENYFTVIGNVSTPDLDTGWIDWYEDYPHPNDFFQPLLAGESIQPTNNTNTSRTNYPDLNAKIARLSKEDLGPEQEAEYAKLDKEFMERAPWAPYGTRTLSTFVSDAINLDSVIFNPTFGQYLTSFEFK
jgi:peptide/nickel transport system substrate-binding protein